MSGPFLLAILFFGWWYAPFLGGIGSAISNAQELFTRFKYFIPIIICALLFLRKTTLQKIDEHMPVQNILGSLFGNETYVPQGHRFVNRGPSYPKVPGANLVPPGTMYYGSRPGMPAYQQRYGAAALGSHQYRAPGPTAPSGRFPSLVRAPGPEQGFRNYNKAPVYPVQRSAFRPVSSLRQRFAASAKRIAASQGNRCGRCKTPLTGTYRVKQLIPPSKGGRATFENLQVYCTACFPNM